MSRIRTIKPEFWSAEQVMELRIPTRLCFAGMWNFADDNGVHPASAKTLKAEVFPSDDLTADDVAGFVSEMIKHGLVGEFETEDGKRYWFVTGWHRHQRIDRPTFKHPAPPTGKIDEPSTNTRRALDEQSTNDQRTLDDRSTPERKGRERKLKPIANTDVSSVAKNSDQAASNKSKPDCPHQEIIGLYHELLPASPRIRDWTPARAALLRNRWNEDPTRQNPEYWKRLFEYISESDFLTGKVATPGRKAFAVALEWLLKPENFAKVREGRYHREAAQ
jgi:hypothetical protein